MKPGTTRSAAGRLLIGAALLGSLAAGCEVGVAEYPEGYYYDDYPPDAYIATTVPFYYDGYPTYWWNGHWYYRVGGRWAFYQHEPRALYDQRIHAPPVRHNYEPAFHGGPSHFAAHGGGFHGGGAHGGGGGRR